MEDIGLIFAAHKLVSLLRAYNFRVHKPMDYDASDEDTSFDDTTSSTPTLDEPPARSRSGQLSAPAHRLSLLGDP